MEFLLIGIIVNLLIVAIAIAYVRKFVTNELNRSARTAYNYVDNVISFYREMMNMSMKKQTPEERLKELRDQKKEVDALIYVAEENLRAKAAEEASTFDYEVKQAFSPTTGD